VREGLLRVLGVDEAARRACGQAARDVVRARYTSRHEIDRYLVFFGAAALASSLGAARLTA